MKGKVWKTIQFAGETNANISTLLHQIFKKLCQCNSVTRYYKMPDLKSMAIFAFKRPLKKL